MPKHIHSTFNTIKKLPNEYSREQMLNEPMIRGASWDYAYQHGGDIVKAVMAAVPEGWKDVSAITVKTHRLIEGYYPSPIGWHSDIYLHNRNPYDDHTEIDYLNVWFGDSISATEYFVGDVIVPDEVFQKQDMAFWYGLDGVVHDALRNGQGDTYNTHAGELVYLDGHSLHRSAPAKFFGIRTFVSLLRDKARRLDEDWYVNIVDPTSVVYVNYPFPERV